MADNFQKRQFKEEEEHNKQRRDSGKLRLDELQIEKHQMIYNQIKKERESSNDGDLEVVKPLQNIKVNQSPILERIKHEKLEQLRIEEQNSYEKHRRLERQAQYSKLINEVYVPRLGQKKSEQTIKPLPMRINLMKEYTRVPLKLPELRNKQQNFATVVKNAREDTKEIQKTFKRARRVKAV